MAGIGYGHRGHRGHSTYNGGRPHSDEWNKGEYDGKLRMVIGSSPHNNTERYVETTETVELVYSPLTSEYGHGSPEVTRHSSPVHDSPRKVEELLSKLQIETSRPNRHDHHSTGHHGTPGYGSYEDDHDYKKNKEFHNPNKYDEYYRDKKKTTSPTHHSTKHSTKPNGSPGYDDYYYDNKNTTDPYKGDELYKPSANYKRHDDGFARPSHANVSTPHSRNAKLGLPTNNIDEAIGTLKGSSKPMSVNTTHPTTRYSAVPKQVDSLEAVKGHDKHHSPIGHVMSSNEVARKYGGKLIRA